MPGGGARRMPSAIASAERRRSCKKNNYDRSLKEFLVLLEMNGKVAGRPITEVSPPAGRRGGTSVSCPRTSSG
jgi:hypothetical protein